MSGTLDTELFLSLPYELQEIIISHREDLVRIFSRVNSSYMQLLEKVYYEQSCNKYISNEEWDNVYNTQPVTMVIYVKDTGYLTTKYLLYMRHKYFNPKITLIEITNCENYVKLKYFDENEYNIMGGYDRESIMASIHYVITM